MAVLLFTAIICHGRLSAAGNVSVTATTGTGGPYSTLGAAFSAINAGTFKGAIYVTINGSTTETGSCVLNYSGNASASYTSVVIKPAASCSITGNVSGPLIKLFGASNVIIDGSMTTGGITRDLTITNTTTLTTLSTAVIQVDGTSGHGAINDTIKNCNISGNSAYTTFAGIISCGDGISAYSPQFAANTGFTAYNNAVSNVQWGIADFGPSTAPYNSGVSIKSNLVSTIGKSGILVTWENNMHVDSNIITGIVDTFSNQQEGGIVAEETFTGAQTSITGNRISNISSTGMTSTIAGIFIDYCNWPAGAAINGNTIYNISASRANCSGLIFFQTAVAGTAFVNGNNIHDVSCTSANPDVYNNDGASGMFLGTSATTANSLVVSNNFISQIYAHGYSTSGSGNLIFNGNGIVVYSGEGYNFYFNSINLAANQTLTGQSAAMYIASGNPAPGLLNIEDNLFVNSETTGATYGIYSEGNKSAFTSIDYNDYYAATDLGYISSTPLRLLAALQTGLGGNLHSGGVLPNFVSDTDLHLTPYNNFCLASGTPISGITTDIDGDARLVPDMGADEFTFSFTSTTVPSTCPGSDIVVTLRDTTGELAAGTYIITYKLSAPNASNGDTVTLTYLTSGGAGSGTFTIPASLLTNNGATTITITGISSTQACFGDFTVVPVTVPATAANQATFQFGTGTGVTPGIIISTAQSSLCTAVPTTFTAAATNGGTTPVYQWKKNGINTGSNTNTYVDSVPANNDIITCVLTSNLPCASPDTATSNSITLTIGAAVIPSISIAASADTICSGVTVIYSAIPVNGGANPAYQWQVNGINAPGISTDSFYTTNSLANGAIVTCILTSNAQCVNPDTATSNAETIVVSGSAVVPTISISGSDTICAGSPDNFIAITTNGGNAPTYQWKVNGITEGTDSVFSSTTLSNNDIINCLFISNANCANPASNTSNSIQVTVPDTVTPIAIISASASAICPGQRLNLIASVSGQGSNPVYQWLLNGNNFGPGTSSFTTNAIDSNSTVTLNLTSSLSCATSQKVTSNSIIIKVNPLPAVTIGSLPDTLCNSQGPIQLSGTPAGGLFTGVGVIEGTFYPDSIKNQLVSVAYTITDTNNCTNTAFDTLLVEVCTEVKESMPDALHIYPNPFGNVIHISANSNQHLLAGIYDVSGKELFENIAVAEDTKSLDLSLLTNGIYLLKVKDESGITRTYKIIKQ